MTAALTSTSVSTLVEQEQATAPLVSVIIRTKDRPAQLRRALRSLSEQSHERIEVIIVNDGGGDLETICNDFQTSFKAVNLLSPPAPGGRVLAANTGLEATSGDYVIFLDDDDWFHTDHLEKLVDALQEDSSAGAAYTGIECLQADSSGVLRRVHHYDQPFEHTTLRIRNFIPIHAVLLRRRFVDEGLRMDTSLGLYEDWDFWLQLAEKTRFRHVPGISAVYYLDQESGFALKAEDSVQREAEERVLSKWKGSWSPSDVREIVEQARKVPELRHNVHLVEQASGALQQELEAAHGKFEATRRELRAAREEIAGLQRQAREAHARHEELQRLYDEILASTSWRVTAPLRFLIRKGRAAIGQAHDTRLRLRNAANIIRRDGPAAYWAYVKARSPFRARPAPRGPYTMLEVEPAAFAATARSLSLPAAEQPLVSVIIPVYNHLDLTLACLLSIAEKGAERSFEVIVVDDASTDASGELLPTINNLRYLRSVENRGFVHSCNLAAASARGEYLLFLNNDTQVVDGWLDKLVDVLETRPDAGIAGAKLIYPSGHLQEAGACLHQDGTVTLTGLNQNPEDPRYNWLREVDHCSGACFLIRRAHFEELDGFDARYAPAYFEDCDLSLRMREKGYKVYYQPASQVLHHLSKTTNENLAKQQLIERNKVTYLERWGKKLEEEDKVRLIAFYLPQYHPIPENDAWWGKGFTEWSNVTKATPNFKGHYQPHQPADLGYYDLRVPEVREEQARLAREHGIYGFCYYYYWFDGKRLLERPLNDILASGKPDFPFCLCWANENWTRRWDGRESDILIAQNYSEESNLAFILELLPVFRDPRYIRIHGKPLLLVYQSEQIPRLAETVALWRAEVAKAGLEGLYLAAVETNDGMQATPPPGFDALVEFPPHVGSLHPPNPPTMSNKRFRGQVFDYVLTAENLMARELHSNKVFRSVMPSWDNTARRQDNSNIFINASPWMYEKWLTHIVRQTRELRAPDERIVFVNAWNEWAEGNHLEPDRKYGHAWLEATRSALGELGYYEAAPREEQQQ